MVPSPLLRPLVFLLPFHVVGVSHEANAADVVGRLRLSPERLHDALAALHRRHVPAVILSTCHRTELYWWGEEELSEWFTRTLLGDAGAGAAARPRFVHADADLAVRHLFSVAAGMKSVRFGEPEILGQVRRAWTVARDAGTARGDIDATFRYAIEAARHVRAAMGHEADASLGERVHERLSVAFAGTAGTRTEALRMLVVGSGDAARGVLAALRASPIDGAHIAVTSRTDSRASQLAADFGLPAIPWSDREDAMREADAVVFAVHVTTPLVPASFTLAGNSRTRPALWIDLGVPGAVDAAFTSSQVQLVSLATIEAADEATAQSAPWRAFHDARQRRAAMALQQELARYARAAHRHQLGAKLGALEEQAVAVASSFRDAPMDEMVRKVTRLVLREFSRT